MTLPWYKFKNHGNTLWPWWHFLLLFLFSYIRLKGLWRFTQSKSLPYCNKENRQCSQALIDHLLWLQRTLSSRRWESDQYIRSWITYQINANAAVSAWYLVYWLYQNVLVSKGQVFFFKKMWLIQSIGYSQTTRSYISAAETFTDHWLTLLAGEVQTWASFRPF